MNVADAMTPRSELVTVEVPGTRDDVLEYLQEYAFSSVPVVKTGPDGEEYRGLVSRESLIEHPDEDQLALLMADVPTTTADTSIEAVARVMVTERARRVPVVDGELEGIVTVTDVVHAIAHGDAKTDAVAEAYVTRDVNTTYAGTPLPVAEREIHYANVPYAVVLDEDADVAGVLTEVDILDVARIVEGEDATGESIADEDDDWMWEGIKAVGGRYVPTRNVEIPTEPVADFMTSDVVTVSTSKTIQAVAQLMIQHDVEQVPMVSGDRLVGIVRDMDVLEALYD
jgi:CBS domain-containing protein